ncbi:hypothetical protein PUNSTDRAFT_143489 [Punctularia strigosozonata HHB-11173 SS5]|uniref:uncharacterized protein n=1 Tax=Punctularia strigosozonata (strain HHB-11173) TaxID=741275 RepID=UPI0004418166|nr:uncharacterized protein PUNSTDRAFT_143489 [Punctularia strigosozonata HHB-11173 SS5]EIN08762.1 hypothetical protein PUNSTDRAFT_143489 [Punctularia strigosozonata HHB-11173 SS5]
MYFSSLPLSIDESTLEALVTPYKIKSSRFFQTKLSNPPRVIAFVRLETRAACEEIIERLHGRMVRGWNDTGSRISVRFADSNEQRELRRNERVPRETDAPSPAKLTMAQAALLNLHGGAQIRSPSLPQLSPRPGLDPALVLPPSSSLPAHPVVASYQQSSPILPEVDNHMAALLSTLHGPTLGDINAAHPGNSRARYNGYTAVEQQLILQAQRDALELQQQQLIRDQQEALALQAKQQALALEQARLQKQLAASRPLRARAETFSPTDRLPMTEAAFHASARDFTRTENINRSNHSRLASTGTSLPSIESAVHARSTTLPSHHRNRSASISKNAHHRKASATVDTKPGAIIDSHDNATNAASNPQKITNAPSAPTHVMHEDSPLVSPALTFAASSPATSTSTLSPASPMFVPGSVGFGKASVTISDGTHIDGLGLGVGVDNSKVQSVESNIRD